MKRTVVMSVMLVTAAAAGVPRLTALIQTRAALPVAAHAQGTDVVPAGHNSVALRQVELFADVVGFFQYGGLVRGNSSSTLYFRSGQINDVLKSLVFQDAGGGQVGQADFPSSQPLSVTLRSFLINLDGSPGMAGILGQLRGHSITLAIDQTPARTLHGRVVDVVQRPVYDPAAKPGAALHLCWYVNLYSVAGGLQSVRLSRVASLHISNDKLAGALKQALGALAGRTNAHKRPLTLMFKGNGTRPVQFAYLLETPLWRLSYRLILPAKPGVKPQLEMMAIIANQTDMNWRHISLHLMGSRPLSYIQDLYRPIYQWRPVLPLARDVSLWPQTYGRGMAASSGNEAAAFGGAKPSFALPASHEWRARLALLMPNAAAKAPAAALQFAQQNQSVLPMFNPLQGLEAMAHSSKAHPAFDYRADNVSVAAQQSAMIPIFITPVTGHKLDLFDATPGGLHPLRSVRLTNNTGKFLMAGPMTVLRGGTYAGDSMVSELGQKASQIVSYAVDQSVTVRAGNTWSHGVLLSAGLNHGSLLLTHADDAHSGYSVVNRSDLPRHLIIRENRWSGWHVAAPVKRASRRGDQDQYTIDVPAGKTVKLAILRRRVATDQIALVGYSRSSLKALLKRPHLPDTIIQAINQAIALRRTLAHKQSRLSETLATEARIQAYQAHLRRNLQALNLANTVYNTMAQALANQETKLEAERKIESKNRGAVQAAQDALAAFWQSTKVGPTAAR
ncbi:MAG: hypothetical protein HKL96_00780 [Phycisphaerales bacterium]|nr:hypothetical protein [Phycisphaerales bacterium]